MMRFAMRQAAGRMTRRIVAGAAVASLGVVLAATPATARSVTLYHSPMCGEFHRVGVSAYYANCSGYVHQMRVTVDGIETERCMRAKVGRSDGLSYVGPATAVEDASWVGFGGRRC